MSDYPYSYSGFTPDDGKERCDFCSSERGPLRRFRAERDVTMNVFSLGHNLALPYPCECHLSDELAHAQARYPVAFARELDALWDACPDCAPLIREPDPEALFRRGAYIHNEIKPGPGREFIELAVHLAFWLHYQPYRGVPYVVGAERHDRWGEGMAALTARFMQMLDETRQQLSASVPRPWEQQAKPAQSALRYSAALEQQLDLLRFYSTNAGTASFSPGGQAALRDMLRTLRAATPVFVSRQITATLEDAFSGLPDNPLHEQDVPMTDGFVFLDGSGLELPRSSLGYVGHLRGIAWQRVRFDKPGHELDGKQGVCVFAFGPHIDPGKPSAADALWQVLALDEWAVGEGFTEGMDLSGIGPALHYTRDRSIIVRQYLASLWSFMEQKLTRVSHERPDRPLRRRLAHDPNQPFHNPVIQVIELRARRYTGQTEPDHPGVEWSCSWVVRGHWMNAWVPSLGRHRRVFRQSYIKGPPNLPLKNATRLFAVVR